MNSGDNETLKAYIDESLEHLADIESDLLEMEKAGSERDDERVNRVFRAAHSIKGGAGFIGLENIKTLSHHMESVLGLIRKGELTPDPENINFLLLASDTLKELLTHVEESDRRDISHCIEALSSIIDRPEAKTRKTTSKPDENRTPANFPKEPRSLKPSASSLERIKAAREEGKSVYLIDIPLTDSDQNGHEPGGHILQEARSYGTLLEHELDQSRTPETLVMLFACVLDLEDVGNLFGIDTGHIHEITEEAGLPVPSSTGLNRKEDETATTLDADNGTTISHPSSNDSVEMPARTNMVKGPGPNTLQVEDLPGSSSKDIHEAAPDSTLRVHVGLLDSLMTLAGELVLGRNQLLQSLSGKDPDALDTVGKRIDRITSELQEAVMRTRMQPIGNVFNKFPRVARDLSRKLGKEVALTIEGKDVELDKTLIEAIGDPLTHLVRNAIDHGIERPEQREKRGKHPIGQIRLNAFHEAGQVIIEIEDDGRGLDGEKLAAKAVEKGFITGEQAGRLSGKERTQLIFMPGFSLAEEITDLSGRGVGMDVVKTNLDRLGGQIDISTETGEGTVVRIKVPLTLAIIPSQIILAEGERYAIPQVNLVELIRVPASQIRDRLEIVGGAEVVRLRSKLLPLVRLADILGLRRTFMDPGTEEARPDRRKRVADRRSKRSSLFGSRNDVSPEMDAVGSGKSGPDDSIPGMRSGSDRRFRADSGLSIVVVSSGHGKYGLVVDALFDSEEIVVHPLGRHLKRTKGYAGATIMGDGRVALILDVTELAQLAQLSPVDKSARAKELEMEKKLARESMKDSEPFLVFRNAEEERFAVPLSQVIRIEKITYADVETVSGKKVIRYRGGNLLVFAIDQVAAVKPMGKHGDVLVLVFSMAEREIGLLAKGPVDAVDVTEKVDKRALKQAGILGSIVIDGHTTLLVDVFDIISTLNPQWFTQNEALDHEFKSPGKILIAEDSDFFRDQVKGFIEAEGYSVIEARDGLTAWRFLEENGEEISLVVTDLEMPNLDGFGLAEKIKSDERYSHLPVIALTTLADDDDIERGRKSGIDDYQIKLDREQLMESIDRFMREVLNAKAASGRSQ